MASTTFDGLVVDATGGGRGVLLQTEAVVRAVGVASDPAIDDF